jgi:hypothetical protein
MQTTGKEHSEASNFIAELNRTPDSLALIKSFTQIKDKKLRRCIVALIAAMGEAKSVTRTRFSYTRLTVLITEHPGAFFALGPVSFRQLGQRHILPKG